MKTISSPFSFNRRDFLTINSVGLAALLLRGSFSTKADKLSKGPRRLVVLEMNGGNDGLNTFIPYGLGAYYDRRKDLAIAQSQVLPLNSKWGFHPALPRLKKRYETGQVAAFLGVGFPGKQELSHFAMQDIWRSGYLTGFYDKVQTGWLGRLLDQIAEPTIPLAGFTLAASVSPAMFSQADKNAASEYIDSTSLEIPPELTNILRNSFQKMAIANKTDNPVLKVARRGMVNSLPIADLLSKVGKPNSAYSQTYTGYALAFTAQILAANDWIRVVHVPLPLDFDTHVDQLSRQQANLSELDTALESFLNELERLNLADQTVVVTTSEFGRRVSDNDGDGSEHGTDHGTANTHFVIGKRVKGGMYGDSPSLTKLDSNGNLIITQSFQDLLATVAEGWMQASAREVVPGGKVQNIFS